MVVGGGGTGAGRLRGSDTVGRVRVPAAFDAGAIRERKGPGGKGFPAVSVATMPYFQGRIEGLS